MNWFKRKLERSNENARHPLNAPGDFYSVYDRNGPKADVFWQPFERCFFERFGSAAGVSQKDKRELNGLLCAFVSLWPTSIPDTTKRFIHRPC